MPVGKEPSDTFPPYPSNSVINDPDQARTLADGLEEANNERSRKAAQWKGLFDGNAPFNQTRRRQKAELWRSNINTMEAKANLSAALVPYYDLFSSGRFQAEIRTAEGRGEEQEHWNRVIAEKFDLMLKTTPSYDTHMQRIIYNQLGFGRGFAIWPDMVQWQFDSRGYSELLFPDGAGVDPDKWDLFVVRVDYPIHMLNRAILDEETAIEAGWRPAIVKDAMAKNATPRERSRESGDDWQEVQREINDHDLYVSVRSKLVSTWHVFGREHDGHWSKGIVLRKGIMGASSKGWLFFSHRITDDVKQLICPYLFETFDGSINGVAGLGKDLFGLMQIKDRIANTMIDNLFIRMSVLLQAKTADARAKAGLAMMGGLAIVPPGYDIQPGTILGDIEGALAVDRKILQDISRNTGIYRPQLEQPTGNPRTLGEMQMQFATAAAINNSQVAQFYNQHDRCIAEVYRRASAPQEADPSNPWITAARKFQKACTEARVPLKAVRNVDSVRALRNVGAGSVMNRQQALSALMSLLPTMQGRGRQNFLDETVAAFTDFGKVAEYYPRDEVIGMPNRDDWDASVEATQIRVGGNALVTDTQDHVAHLTQHFQAAGQAIQSAQGGGQIGEVVAFLIGMRQHIQEHLQLLAADTTRKDELKLFQQQLGQLDKTIAQLQEALATQMEQQQQMQQADAIASGQDPDVARKNAEVGQRMSLRQAQTEQKLRQSEETHQQELRHKEQKQQVEQPTG